MSLWFDSAVYGFAALLDGQQQLDLIGGRENQIAQFGRYRHSAFAHSVKERLHVVSEAGDLKQSAHGPGALDGMKSAEELVHSFGRLFFTAETKCGLLNIRDELVCLGQERLDWVVLHRLYPHFANTVCYIWLARSR